jgi:hypothetical protein
MHGCNEYVIEYGQPPCKVNIPEYVPKEQVRKYLILRKPE